MTSDPPPERYLAHHGPIFAPTNPRPASVIVLAVIGIILGSFAILNYGVLGLLLAAGGRLHAMGPPFLRRWQFADWSISLAFGVFLLGSCVGALMLRPWARQALLVYAGTYLPWLVVSAAVTMTWIVPTLRGRPAAEGRTYYVGHEEDQVDLYRLEILLMAVVAVYPLCLLCFLTRPRVRAAFAAAGLRAGGYDPGGASAPDEGRRGVARGPGPPPDGYAPTPGPPPLPPAG